MKGIWRIAVITVEMAHWTLEHEYESAASIRGSMSQKSIPSPAAFECAHGMRAITLTALIIMGPCGKRS